MIDNSINILKKQEWAPLKNFVISVLQLMRDAKRTGSLPKDEKKYEGKRRSKQKR